MMKDLLVYTLFVCLGTGALADSQYVGAVGGVRVIDGPGALYRTVGHLGYGTKVTVLERYEGYALVARPGAVEAWVKGDALQVRLPQRRAVAQATEVAEAPKVTEVDPYASVVWTKSGPLNMRGGPGLTHPVLSQCQRGDWVEVFAKAGEWAKIRIVTGEQGWVHTAYLTR